jgi:fatty-acyl-CoA synthase
MQGLMQQPPLLISTILRHAARHHAAGEIVSKTTEGAIHRTTYAALESRARRLTRVLARLGIGEQDRVGTLAWNGYRHLEVYYAAPGMGAICHTINPRLHPDDIAFIITHAGDAVLFADTSFTALLETIAPRLKDCVRAIVLMTDAANMPALALPAGMALHCYDALMDAADDDFTWPSFEETTASALCYTSGTTGRPKGVLYSHRSTVLHAYAISMPDVLCLRATDRILPVVPMFHVNAWGIPYGAALAGTSLVLPGRHLDGASLHALLNAERVNFTCGVPTVWMGLLAHLRATGGRLDTLRRIMTGGSACPPLLIEAFGAEYGVAVEHGWGMTELSPVGTYNTPKPVHADRGATT